MMIKSQKVLETYGEFNYLISYLYDTFSKEEQSIEAVAGRILAELQPMAETKFEKEVLYFQFAHFFAIKENRNAFEAGYKKLEHITTGNLFQFADEMKEAMKDTPYDTKEMEEFHREIQKNITDIKTYKATLN